MEMSHFCPTCGDYLANPPMSTWFCAAALEAKKLLKPNYLRLFTMILENTLLRYDAHGEFARYCDLMKNGDWSFVVLKK